MEEFEQLFEASLDTFGAAYRQIRDKVVAMDSAKVTTLDQKLKDPDWKVRLQAEIFMGWRTDLEQNHFIRRVAEGTEPTMEGEKYLTGKPPVGEGAEWLVRLGSAYLPSLLEILYKEPDLLTNYSYWVCTRALLIWKDRRVLPVYEALLMDGDVHPAFRGFAIQPLLEMGAGGLFEDLVLLYENENNPLGLRAVAVASVGALNDDRAIPFLEHIFIDPETETSLRSAAVDGLGETHDAAVVEILAPKYPMEGDYDLKENIILALGNIEDSTAIDALKQIRTAESDPRLVELLDEELEEMN